MKAEVIPFATRYSRGYSIPGETAQVCLESDCGAVFSLDGVASACPRCGSDAAVSLWKLLNAIALAPATPVIQPGSKKLKGGRS